MATISNTPRPGYVYDSTDAVWYPIGTGSHNHSEIPSTIVDAKGDIIAASAADTPARLAVGNNGETLVADSAATTGLRYSATPSASNPIINGAFNIWQRGTSIVGTTTVFGPDRWNMYRGSAGSTVTRQTVSDTTNLPSIQYCARVQRDSGNTGTGVIVLAQSIETANSIPFAGKTVAFSFYARCGANYSMASSQIVAQLSTGTGTDQNYATTGFTGEVTQINQSPTLTTTWQRFSYSVAIPSTATEISVQYRFTPVGTAGAADYFEVTGVQLDVGSVALPFRTNGGTIQGELAACQRYYWRAGDGTGGAYGVLGTSGYTSSTTNSNVIFVTPVRMRVAPTTLDYSAFATTRILNLGAPFTATAASITSNSTTPDAVWVQFTSSGMTASQFSQFTRNNDATAFIGFSAEL